jgi:hypothetical protein
MDIQQVTKNVREVAACPPDHVITVLPSDDEKHKDEYPATISHEVPSENGRLGAYIPVNDAYWKSIVDGDKDAESHIKEIVDLAHATHKEME